MATVCHIMEKPNSLIQMYTSISKSARMTKQTRYAYVRRGFSEKKGVIFNRLFRLSPVFFENSVSEF